jgi:hypothetical protein
MRVRPGAAQAPIKELRLMARHVAGLPDLGRRAWCYRRLGMPAGDPLAAADAYAA